MVRTRLTSSGLSTGGSFCGSLMCQTSAVAGDQEGLGSAACGYMIVALVIELGLHRFEEITVQDGGLLPGKDLAVEEDHRYRTGCAGGGRVAPG